MICQRCGNQNYEGDKFCRNCGLCITIDLSNRTDLSLDNEFIEMYNQYSSEQLLDILNNINDYSEKAQYAAQYIYNIRKEQGVDFEEIKKVEAERIAKEKKSVPVIDYTKKGFSKGSAYCLTFIPLFHSIICFLKLNDDTVLLLQGIIYFMFLTALAYDSVKAKTAGYKGFWTVWGIIFLPVYFYLRARKIDKKYRYFIITLVYSIFYIEIKFIKMLFS